MSEVNDIGNRHLRVKAACAAMMYRYVINSLKRGSVVIDAAIILFESLSWDIAGLYKSRAMNTVFDAMFLDTMDDRLLKLERHHGIR